MVFSSGQMVGVDEQRSERGPHRDQQRYHGQQQQQQVLGGEEHQADNERYRYSAISAPPPSRSVGRFEKLLRRCVSRVSARGGKLRQRCGEGGKRGTDKGNKRM